MKLLIKSGNVYYGGGFCKMDILIADSEVQKISADIPVSLADKVLYFENYYIIPGFADAHVHLREPGFSYKETIATGTLAAARGGYTAVCPMPNLNPPPDCAENMRRQLGLIDASARIKVYPYATITKGQIGSGQLVNFEELAQDSIGFSDDGRGVQSEELMRAAMKQVAALGGIIAAHCEDESELSGGYIHDGEYAHTHGHKGINSESEWKQVERDLRLVKETGCRYHICHVSTKESVRLIRRAKSEGLPVSCETAPHYLVLCDSDLQESGSFKMNPPLRAEDDRTELILGIQDGTIDMIATDHAPHSAEEKGKGLAASAMGIVGLETSFPILYTELVEKGIITLPKLIELMAIAPRRVFGMEGGIAEGEKADIAVLDLQSEFTIDPQNFLSLGRSTPFAGRRVKGENIMTIVNGRIVWEKNITEN